MTKAMLYGKLESCPGDIKVCIDQLCANNPPLYAWAEPESRLSPDGKRGRVKDFRPFVKGDPTRAWSALPIMEARLFWARSAAHLVRDGKTVKIYRYSETNDLGPEASETEYETRTSTALRLGDTSRFGLNEKDTAQWPGQFTIIEYTQNGRCVAWRIVEKKE